MERLITRGAHETQYHPLEKAVSQERTTNKLNHTPLDIQQIIDVQRKTINAQHAITQDQFPPHIGSLFSTHRGFSGRTTISEKSGIRYEIAGFRNSCIIQKQRKLKNILLFFPHYAIDEYWFIDKKTGKGMELHSLLNPADLKKPYQIHSIPSFGSSANILTRNGPVIVLNDLTTDKRLINKYGIKPEEVDIINIIAPFHESAHALQTQNKKGKDNLSLVLLKNYLAKKLFNPLMKHFSNVFQLKKIRQIKEKSVWQERNAHAFALNLIHKLKKQDIDLLSGYNNQVVSEVVNKALISYDKSGLGMLPGRSFSRQTQLH